MEKENQEKKGNRKKFIIILLVSILLVMVVLTILYFTHIICFHEWKPATCVSPSTCSICNRTKGEAIGHKVGEWNVIKEPTCTEEGKQKGTCEYCKAAIEETIPKKPHLEGEWVILKEADVNPDGTVTPGKRGLPCSECGEILKNDEYTIELTLSQKNALKKITEIDEFLHCSYTYMVEDYLIDVEGFDKEDATFAADNCDIDWDNEAILAAEEAVNDGKSKNGVIDWLKGRGFNNSQIDKAINAVGY